MKLAPASGELTRGSGKEDLLGGNGMVGILAVSVRYSNGRD
jgi:hypothetical protein